jgi:predicted metal-dependent HD superfamily phosphohydrolase
MDPGAVQLALWFHDAIYDTHRSSNEEESARWACETLAAAGAEPAMKDRVRSFILATKHDAAPVAPDARLTVDIDLSILGAPVARFDEYESQIRREYAWVPERVYAAERAKILRGFLARAAIYGTAFFANALEGQARSNLERSLSRLNPQGAGP